MKPTNNFSLFRPKFLLPWENWEISGQNKPKKKLHIEWIAFKQRREVAGGKNFLKTSFNILDEPSEMVTIRWL